MVSLLGAEEETGLVYLVLSGGSPPMWKVPSSLLRNWWICSKEAGEWGQLCSYPRGKGRWLDTGDGVSSIRGSCIAMSLVGLYY